MSNMKTVFDAAKTTLSSAELSKVSPLIASTVGQIAQLEHVPHVFDDTVLETAVWGVRRTLRRGAFSLAFGRRLAGSMSTNARLTNLLAAAFKPSGVDVPVELARIGAATDTKNGQTLLVADLKLAGGLNRSLFTVSEATVSPAAEMFNMVGVEFDTDPIWADRALLAMAAQHISDRAEANTAYAQLVASCEQEMAFTDEDLADGLDAGYGGAPMQISALIMLLDDINTQRAVVYMGRTRVLKNAEGGWDPLDMGTVEDVIDYYIRRQGILCIADTLCGFVMSPELPSREAVHSLAASIRAAVDAFKLSYETAAAWRDAIEADEIPMHSDAVDVVNQAIAKAAE
jgi:hypothetical protein